MTSHTATPCCERDTDGDGNCPFHPENGVMTDGYVTVAEAATRLGLHLPADAINTANTVAIEITFRAGLESHWAGSGKGNCYPGKLTEEAVRTVLGVKKR